MRDYDFYEQMKYLGFKRNRLAMVDKNDKNYSAKQEMIKDRTVFVERDEDEDENKRHVNELILDGNDRTKNFYDYLFASLEIDGYISGDTTGTNKKYKTHRIININEVYPVRDYGFYYDYRILNKIREENPAYKDLDDRELTSALAKESFDPLFIYIESEPAKNSRQLIINVNVSNTNEFNDRPIILIYDGENNSYPVILNLNADFRGILYAPNSSVAINGNEHDFQGFVVAQSYIALLTENEDEFGDYNPIYELESTLLVDDYGEIQYKEEIQPSSRTNNEIFFNIEAFNLNNSEFDSFNLVKINNYTKPSYSSGLINNLFLQPPE